MNSDIPIRYVNCTGRTDFEVVVFTENCHTAPETPYAAWQVLRGQSSVEFIYPVSMAVGVTCKLGGQLITAGPFPAELGSTWEISQDDISKTAVLKQIEDVSPNSCKGIFVRNIPTSDTRCGQIFDVGVYKDGKLLVVQPDIRVGCQAYFLLQPKLYFAVVRNMMVGDIFTSMEITSIPQEFDLNKYPNGMIVTVSEKAIDFGGQYTFTASAM